MSQAAAIRDWARASGYTVGVRGVLAPAIVTAYFAAHPNEQPYRTPARATTAIAQCTCGRKWGGYKECHCTVCHRHFSVVQNFDWHIPGKCEDPGTVTDSKGALRMKLADSVWGPIWVGAGDHYRAESD